MSLPVSKIVSSGREVVLLFDQFVLTTLAPVNELERYMLSLIVQMPVVPGLRQDVQVGVRRNLVRRAIDDVYASAICLVTRCSSREVLVGKSQAAVVLFFETIM